MSVCCAFAKIEDVPGLQGLSLDALSDSEQARWASFGSDKRRHVFLAGRMMARWVLARRLGLPISEAPALSLEIDALGRSSFPARPDLGMSISHSGEGIACAAATGAVGIDIEDLSRPRDFLALAAQVHSSQQCLQLAAQAEDARAESFYRWWTLKEAWLKRQGLGLDLARMRRLEIVPVDALASALSLVLVCAEQRWTLALQGAELSEGALDFCALSPGTERQSTLSFRVIELGIPSGPN